MTSAHPISVPITPFAKPVVPRAVLRRRLRNSRLMAAALLVPGIPVIAACAALVRLTSRGNPIYSQERVGLNGRVFKLYKIRSMTVDAEDGIGPIWAQTGDPRVTRIGAVLRFTHLDELPQLFNILRGEMCINGPRPERPEFVEELTQQLPRYSERLAVHPGVTGLAQICSPADRDLRTVRSKLSLDLAYIRDLTSARVFDLRILSATVLKMIGMPPKVSAQLLLLDRIQPEPLEPETGHTEEAIRRAA